MTEHVHEWLVILDTGTVVCNGCPGYGQMPPDEVARRLNAMEKLSQLAKDIRRGEAEIEWRELIPENQRGEIAKRNWYDPMFSYGMEYGVLAAAALEDPDGE